MNAGRLPRVLGSLLNTDRVPSDFVNRMNHANPCFEVEELPAGSPGAKREVAEAVLGTERRGQAPAA